MKTCVGCEARGNIRKATKAIVDSFGSKVPLCDECYDAWLLDTLPYDGFEES